MAAFDAPQDIFSGWEIAWEGSGRNRDRTPHWLPRTNNIVSTYAAIHRDDSVRADGLDRDGGIQDADELLS